MSTSADSRWEETLFDGQTIWRRDDDEVTSVIQFDAEGYHVESWSVRSANRIDGGTFRTLTEAKAFGDQWHEEER